MLVFLNNENNEDLKIAIFSDKNNYRLQIINGIHLELDITISTVELASDIAKRYGFDLPTMAIRNAEITGKPFIENQALSYV